MPVLRWLIFHSIFSLPKMTGMKKIFTFLFGALTLLSQAQPCKEVVGYYPDWQYYDRSTLLKPEKLDYSKYTVINYAFFNPQTNGTVITGDQWATDNILLGPDVWSPYHYHDSTKSLPYLCKANGVKCVMSIGGWSWSANFPTIAGSAATRTAFAHNCTDLVRQYKLDGIDIDWEYPTAGDKNNYTLMMKEVKDSLTALGNKNGNTYIITGAYPAGPANAANYDWATLTTFMDMFNLMAYDLFGQWDAISNHNAPLYAPAQGTSTFNCDAAVTLLTQTYGVPANKLNMGIAFYGRAFANCTALFGTHSGADSNTFPEEQGSPLYYNVMKNMSLFNYNWDSQAQVPYLLGSGATQTFVSYDDKRSIGIKASYILSKNLRGAIIWEITGDYMETAQGSGVIAGTPLADTLNQVMCSTTGVNENRDMQTTFLFPNPCGGSAWLHYKAQGEVFVQVFDAQGRIVHAENKGVQQGGNAIELKLEGKGIYIVQLFDGKQMSSMKMIVE